MNLRDHAKAIQSVIMAAANDGFELDNGDGEPIHGLDLNQVDGGTIGDWVSIELPKPTFY